jgi:hypothetical protein
MELRPTGMPVVKFESPCQADQMHKNPVINKAREKMYR